MVANADEPQCRPFSSSRSPFRGGLRLPSQSAADRDLQYFLHDHPIFQPDGTFGLIGSIAASEIAQAYHPDPRTQYTLIGRSLLFRFAGLVGLNLFEELILKNLTTHTPKGQSAANVPVLREGTPVTLIAVEGFGTHPAAAGQTVTFVLAQPLTLRGKMLARAGDIASGLVTQVSPGNTPGGVKSVALQHVTLRAGTVNVPLRSNQVRGAAAPVQYKQLPGSGKVEVTLFVAENVQFPESQ